MKLRVLASALTLASVALAVAYYREQGTTRALTTEVTKLSRQNAELRADLKQATKQAEDFGRHAVDLDSQLGSAKSRTTATESKHAQLNRELNETKSQLGEREQREVALMAELATLRQKVAEAAGPAPISPNVATAAPDPPATTMPATVAGVADPGSSSAALATPAPGSPTRATAPKLPPSISPPTTAASPTSSAS